MHELSITENIIKICCEEADKNKVNTINTITLKVGVLSGIVPESIQFYFDIISKDTKTYGAKLVIERILVKMHCNDCDFESESSTYLFNCDNCGSANLNSVAGNEFLIDHMEVD